MRKRLPIYAVIALLAILCMPLSAAAASGYGWGYSKNKEHKLPDIGKYADMLKKYNAYYADDSGEKNVYVTFDNGYEQGYTSDILDILKKYHVPATFFVTGHYVKSEPDLVKRMVNEGHIVGNHSYHHPDFTIMSKESIQKELESLEEAVAAITDQKEMKYLRPPRGMFSKDTLKWANQLGYIHVFWSLAFKDWETSKQKGWKYAFEQVKEQIHPGAIILLHTVSSDNAKALEKMIQELKRQGYTFKSLDDLVLKSKLPKAIYGL
ncbi:delta-lactam-biosynthetic de-N-acetylase [Virgibacillus pantothenticus]|uniref:Polysaccharide deacetylase n=1 Tax=Virgibacillus pantothenticus TaxID=1473 RepID=A0A0L0QV26_VIRPA|nr:MULTISPECIES: delta-lactam-biosynthetic de-N-acetylase [Virgibacillus]API91303.1 delta-lactam-biosynthetic de-N-acetylase [Virgibacillus sp. 6R]KNE22510.1 polysaccharide deacetylase [Virgibacillus pantothenticus]MBS7426535.1 delta-lactam-biosynthetic de-N-acetylase [Virgibacillus sp. 19R1-5]MBU8567280.1 delta-lactam-biosynthetic de-N-acetylase [Virgibacillus pantothenticus]MBU8600035.1 delta-lactam-biosynthetic de-N-acetylase [Virgibacillus pantothenticus]